MNDREDKKLDWMYKGATSLVDREEYLLGRSVDKSLEQLNQEEKEKKLGIVPPKNHVEHECIPPSIRDFNKIVQAEQVDLSAKLQEDPLVAIKKREEEARRLFLQNPIQLKKLQEALKAQQLKKVERKIGRHITQSEESDSDSDLDRKIVSKLKYLKNDSVDLSLSKKSKKKDNSLDIVLMHKYNQLKDKLSQKDLDDILAGKVSSSSDSSDSESDSESIKKEGSKFNKKNYRSSNNVKENRQKSKQQKGRTDSSEREKETVIKNRKKSRENPYLKTKNKQLRDSNNEDSTSDNKDEKKQRRKNKITENKFKETIENRKTQRRSSSSENEEINKNIKINKKRKINSLSSESEDQDKKRSKKNKWKEGVGGKRKKENSNRKDLNSNSEAEKSTKKATNKSKLKEKVKTENKRRRRNYSDSDDSSDGEYSTQRKYRFHDEKEKDKYIEKKTGNRRCSKDRRKQDDSSSDEHSRRSRYDDRKSSNRRQKSDSNIDEERRKEKTSHKSSNTNYGRKETKTSHEQNSKRHSRSSSESEERIKTSKAEKGKSSDVDSSNPKHVDSSLDQMILQKLRMLRDSKPLKTLEEKDSLPSKNEKIYSHYDSDDDKHTYKVKSFGLVKSDGTKIPLNMGNQEKKVPEVNKKIQPVKVPERKAVKKLSEREKEELRQQMMKDAVTREKERSDNLRKYREDDKKEEIQRNTKQFDKHFVHKELLRGTNSASIESRIKSNLNNIQRSSRDMTTNFSKRN